MSTGAAARTLNSEPNVTPLIDVMLVLLILFMVVTPLSWRTLDAALPAPPASQSVPDVANPLVLSVRADDLDLNGRRFASETEMATFLADVLATRQDRTVFVTVEGEVRYGRMVGAVDSARGAGAVRIGLMTGDAPVARRSR